MELEIEGLPKTLQKRGLKKELTEICERNDIVSWLFSAPLLEENRKNQVTST